MIEEKIFKCSTFYRGYYGIEEIIRELYHELEKGYYIDRIEHASFSISLKAKPEPDLIIYLKKKHEE